MEKKKLYLKTYGCQMNVYDSEKMAALLQPLGFQATEQMEEADMVLLNTCHIREKAADKVYSELGRVRDIQAERRQQGLDTVIGVAGCVAQAEGGEMLRRAPYVDIVVGPQAYHHLPEMVARAMRSKAHRDGRKGKGVGILETNFPAESKFDYLIQPQASTEAAPVSAFLTIQEGCDKFCSFCVVPYTRGAEYSRPAADIIAEAKALAARGVQEITLLGQNVNAYHGEAPQTQNHTTAKTWGLAALLYALAEIPEIRRWRYTTSHPRDMDAALIQAHGAIPQLMPFLHLPVQSGSDRMLEMMNRKHKADLYFDVIDKLRAARADMAFSSDFIVGYPGESDKDFADTMAMIERVEYAQAYSFMYSPRPGTPAAAIEKQIEATVKRERLSALQALLNKQQRQFNFETIGKTMPVLFDKQGNRENQLAGKTPYMQTVLVEKSAALFGKEVDIVIQEAYANSLMGVYIPTVLQESVHAAVGV